MFVIAFMKGIYNYRPETIRVSKVYISAAVLYLQFLLYVMLLRMLYMFGGLGVACWPLVPKFAGSNPAGAVGFLRAKKPSARLLSEGK